MLDPVALAQTLIRCPSVTPNDAGAIGALEAALEPLGFSCKRMRFEKPGTAPVENLYARIGTAAPNFCFAGHTDVVPTGDVGLWQADPFAAEIRNGFLYGRGAADMKSAVAAFAAAAERNLKSGLRGSISLLITGDEEGPAVNGTAAVLEWMRSAGEIINHCVVGEPTSAERVGDMIKIGRRGSMRIDVVMHGVQGHTAYPHRAVNPIPILATLVTQLAQEPLDEGTPHFEPSTLAFTTFDVGNRAGNVSPAQAKASANIRFNDSHTPEKLIEHIRARGREVTARLGGSAEFQTDIGALPFLTRPGAFTELLSNSVRAVTGCAPQLSTTGGTSDARFIKDMCPVAEIGLTGTTMHKADECVPVAEIETLTAIYTAILEAYFASPLSAA